MSPYRRLISGSLLFRFLRGPAQLYVLARFYFCARVMGVDERLQPFLQHMRIDLRRRNVSMSEQLLHGSEIGTAVEQVACKGMTQNRRRNTRGVYAGVRCNGLQVLREALPRNVAECRACRKDPRRIIEAPGNFEKSLQRRTCGRIERHEAFAPPFSLY